MYFFKYDILMKNGVEINEVTEIDLEEIKGVIGEHEISKSEIEIIVKEAVEKIRENIKSGFRSGCNFYMEVNDIIVKGSEIASIRINYFESEFESDNI